LNQVDAAQFRHLDVHEKQVDVLYLQGQECFDGIAAARHDVNVGQLCNMSSRTSLCWGSLSVSMQFSFMQSVWSDGLLFSKQAPALSMVSDAGGVKEVARSRKEWMNATYFMMN
jgi:hypothetical protein